MKCQAELWLDGHLTTRTPHKPYCSADLQTGVRIRRRSTALTLPYLQVNPPQLRFWMVFDIDRPGGALAWEQAGLPPPAWAAMNKVNAHAHLAWGLSAPVLAGDAGRSAPLRYLCAVEAAYREKLQADPGYSGLITKNPLHPQWRVLIGPPRLYELGELAEYIDLERFKPKRVKPQEIGLGRNCALFDWLRQWAYSAVRRHRGTRNFILWQAEAYDKALERNSDFLSPLGGRECWHVAASVAKWTWRRDEAARREFIARQQHRGRLGGLAKGVTFEERRATARLMRAAGHPMRTIAAQLGVSLGAVHGWCSDSQNQISAPRPEASS